MNAKAIISSICILLAICLAFYFYAEWQKARFVAKAWAKVDYLAENPFAWGGNADPKTEALIQQLSEPEYDEGQSEESLQLEMGQRLDELISLRDPRAIETVVAYQCWGKECTHMLATSSSIWGRPLSLTFSPTWRKIAERLMPRVS